MELLLHLEIAFLLTLVLLFSNSDGLEIERPAMQKIRGLGTFYDARSESYLSRTVFVRPLSDDEFTTVLTPEQDTKVRVKEDKITDVDEGFKIEGDLRLSIMAGLISGEVGGSFRKSKFKKTNSVTGTASVKLLTVKIFVDLCDKLVSNLIDPRVSNITATHIITGITYGAAVYVLFRDENTKNDQVLDIESKLSGSITKFANLMAGSITGKVAHNDNKLMYKRNLEVEIKGDIGYQNSGMPVSEDELFTFLQNLHIELDATNGKIGRPIVYHLTEIDSIISECIQKVTNSVTTTIQLHKIEAHLNKVIFDTFEAINTQDRDVEFIWSQMQTYKTCISKENVNSIYELKENFTSKLARYRYKLQQAVIKARSGNTSLLLSGSNLFDKEALTHLHNLVETKYTEFQESIIKLDFFATRGIPCAKVKHSLENTIFVVSDHTVYIFLYNKDSYTNHYSVFMARSHDLLDNCSINRNKCFVVDCTYRNDTCLGYEMNSIYLYIRGQLATSNFSETVNNTSNESPIMELVSDLKDRTFKLERSSRTVDNLINNMHRDHRKLQRATVASINAMELQLNYTYAYERLVFDFILDDLIQKELGNKYKNKQLDRIYLGGLNVTKFCRPYGYSYLVHNLKEECSRGASIQQGSFGNFNYI